jgi:hemerythrin-like domain-containing protein
MRRSVALAPLSRDHQHALDAALRLRRADRGTVVEAIGHFQRFFAREGRRHFAIEEQLLLPAMPADDAEWARCVARVRADHEAIRAGATALADPHVAEDVVAGARALGERLSAHVRFEERAVFDILERRLTAAELERLGQAVAAAEGQSGAPPPRR